MELHICSCIRCAIVIVLSVLPAMCIDQNGINYMSRHMRIGYDVLDNFRDMLWSYSIQLTLNNTGNLPIRGDGWKIYFTHSRMLEPDHLPDVKSHTLGDYNVKVSHVKGGLFTLEPTDGFKDVVPGESRYIQFLGENWAVSRSDVYPNWYLGADGLEPKIIENTADEKLQFVGDFDTVEKWKRYEWINEEGEGHDAYDPLTPRARHSLHDKPNVGRAPLKVIPTPRHISFDESKTVYLGTTDWLIVAGNEVMEEARFLSQSLNIGVTTRTLSSRYIKLTKENIENTDRIREDLMNEAYQLEIDPAVEAITIKGRTAAGIFYGIQSLLNAIDGNRTVCALSIRDAPRYGYRGLMLDIARNFRTKSEIKKLIGIMASYKLNMFHIHLTDDEGWRIQIPGLNELTEVAGRRCHDLTEKSCILPQFGSGPRSTYPGSGYLTMKDYMEILQHAKIHHIQVIPEVDMPGHGHGSIKAMEARRDNMIRSGRQKDAYTYLLAEENDPSNYKSIQMFTDNAVNPCLNSTINFARHVIYALAQMHQNIMPLRVFHFGGDEVAKGAWENSTACAELIRTDPTISNTKQLKEYFAKRISDITTELGLDMAAWEDGFMESGTDRTFDRTRMNNRNIYAYAWDNVWEWGQAGRAYTLANSGYKVVMAQATHLYFDHPYEPDPEEPGLYWALRYTDTKKTYSFMPGNLYAAADVDRAGYSIDEKRLCGERGDKCPPLKEPNNIAGIQGHMFGELLRSPERMDFMLFPRFLALAERAWHESDWERDQNNATRRESLDREWSSFANTLGHRELARLDRLGVKYRVPPPGAKIVNGKLVVNTEFPGLVVEYSNDGGDTWCHASGETAIRSGRTIMLRTRSGDGSRTSRVVSLFGVQNEQFTAKSEARSQRYQHIHHMTLTSMFILLKLF